jgi:hypothetical protein
MGYMDYKFKFVNTDPTDLLEEAQIEDIKIRNGTLSVDEVRRRNGMEEIGLTHFVMTGQGPMFIEDILERETEETPTTTNQRRTQVVEQEDMEDMEDDMERKELAQWKKFCINAVKSEGNHKDFNEFRTNYIKKEKEVEIRKQLEVADDKADIVKIFQYYLNNDYKQIIELRKMFDELSK